MSKFLEIVQSSRRKPLPTVLDTYLDSWSDIAANASQLIEVFKSVMVDSLYETDITLDSIRDTYSEALVFLVSAEQLLQGMIDQLENCEYISSVRETLTRKI